MTSEGAKSTPILTTRVESSGAVTIWSTFSGVQPSCESRKTGVLLSLITRCSEKAASLRRHRIAGGELQAGADLQGEGLAVIAHRLAISATPPTSLVMSVGSKRMMRS